MNGYTKLFSSIVTSSLWSEDSDTRIVWITLLAMADQHGEVQAAIPGLARMAGVTIERTEAALAMFLAPDEYSRSKENEGRRIEVIDGGWALLNHAKYRHMASIDDQREKTRIRVQRHRARNADVTPSNHPVTVGNNKQKTEADTKAEADAESREEEAKKPASPLPPSIMEIHEAWNNQNRVPRCLVISDKRRRMIEARLRDPFFVANWKSAIQRCINSPFCCGKSDRGWRASFDWFITPDVVAKIMEGKYDEVKQAPKPSQVAI